MPLRQKWHSLLAPTKRRNVLQMCREISDCLHILHYSILKSTFRKIRSDQVKIDKSTAKGLEWPRLWIFLWGDEGGCGKNFIVEVCSQHIVFGEGREYANRKKFIFAKDALHSWGLMQGLLHSAVIKESIDFWKVSDSLVVCRKIQRAWFQSSRKWRKTLS